MQISEETCRMQAVLGVQRLVPRAIQNSVRSIARTVLQCAIYPMHALSPHACCSPIQITTSLQGSRLWSSFCTPPPTIHTMQPRIPLLIHCSIPHQSAPSFVLTPTLCVPKSGRTFTLLVFHCFARPRLSSPLLIKQFPSISILEGALQIGTRRLVPRRSQPPQRADAR